MRLCDAILIGNDHASDLIQQNSVGPFLMLRWKLPEAFNRADPS